MTYRVVVRNSYQPASICSLCNSQVYPTSQGLGIGPQLESSTWVSHTLQYIQYIIWTMTCMYYVRTLPRVWRHQVWFFNVMSYDPGGNPEALDRSTKRVQLQNVQLPNVQLPNVYLPNVHLPNVQLQIVQVTKCPGYKTSKLPNVHLTKRPDYWMSSL
jgi:hypothetical protein